MLLPIIVPILSVALGLAPLAGNPPGPVSAGLGNPISFRTNPDRPSSGNAADADQLIPGSAADADRPNSGIPVPLRTNPDQPEGPVAQQSGICGTVYAIGGNRMPAPNRRRVDSATPKHPSHGVKATVYIYSLTSDSQVVHADPTHYRAILTPLISRVGTDENGKFQVFLPPGTYSVFTKKGVLFYASQRDEKNHIAPVEVLPGKMTQVSCSVESDHKAVY
ncbi:MAG: hypothetical protein JST42_30520 [Bacteroidetes bacterium]|nr:hypothetical protein [Bacteroidota bacterium]